MMMNLLNKNKVFGDNYYTHVSLSGGKYSFNRSNLKHFYQVYSTTIAQGTQSLAERRLETGMFVVDIDLKFKIPSPQKKKELLLYILEIIQKTLEKNIGSEDPFILKSIVMEKEPYEKDGIFKDGIHLHYPYIFLNNDDNMSLLKSIDINIDQVQNILGDNWIEEKEIIDVGSGRNPWLMYGSSKPGRKPYKITYFYNEGSLIFAEPLVKKFLECFEEYQVLDEEEELIELDENNLIQNLPRILSIHLYGRNDYLRKINGSNQKIDPVFVSRPKVVKDETIDVKDDVIFHVDMKDMRIFLSHISTLSKNYDTWMPVVFSIYNIFPNEEEHTKLIQYFSGLCPQKYDEDEVNKIIKGLKKNNKGYRFGNLFKLCKDNNLKEAYQCLEELYNKHRPIPKVERIDLESFLDKDCYELSTKEGGYYMYDFLKEINQLKEPLLDLLDLIHLLVPKVNQFMCRLLQQQCWLVKNSYSDQTAFVKKLETPLIYFLDDKMKKPIYQKFDIFVQHYLYNYIRTYETIEFIPCPPTEKPQHNGRVFNTWTGFQATLLSKDKVDIKKIELILYHFKEVWCNGDQSHFEFLIGCYFKEFFLKPHIKTGVAINLVGEQGVGKTLPIDEFLSPYVFGNRMTCSVIGLNKLVQKHNSVLMNKIFCSVNELPNIDIGKKDGFDTLKSLITEKKITFEPKNVNPFEMNNFTRFVFSTNNALSLNIEAGDRRYNILQVSNKHKNDIDYFRRLTQTFNQDTADHFFSYCCYYETNLNPRIVPMSKLKEEMIITCAPSPIRFLHSLKELLSMEYNENLINEFCKKNCVQEPEEKVATNPLVDSSTDHLLNSDNPDFFINILMDLKDKVEDEKEYYVSSKTLFHWYNLFCQGENERPTTLIKFTKMVKEKITSKHSRKVSTMFNIFSIKKIV